MAVVYAINRSVEDGWTSGTVVGFLAAGAMLLGLFVLAESRAPSPLVPLSMFRRRTLTTANVVAALVFGSFFATVFQASLFMQQVLRYSALRTGVAYLAMALTALLVAAGVAARQVGRYGSGVTLAIGQAFAAVGLVLVSRAPVDAAYWADLFRALFLLRRAERQVVAARRSTVAVIPSARTPTSGETSRSPVTPKVTSPL